jgi:hypothetical protein
MATLAALYQFYDLGDPFRPIAVSSIVTYKDFRWLRSHVGLEDFLSDLSEFVRLKPHPITAQEYAVTFFRTRGKPRFCS